MAKRLKPLAEQVIVITGASSGNGLATAREAVRRGAAVVLGRSQRARAQGDCEGPASGPADGSRSARSTSPPKARPSAFAEVATEAFGGFDAWVNDAAVTSYGSLEQLGID